MARWLVARFPGGEMTGNQSKHPSSIRSLSEVFEFQEVDHCTLSLGVFCNVYCVV